MSIHKTEALVLNRRNFRETSLIVEFFTRDFGKIRGILKGIREEPSKFASIVEPFSHNEIIFYRKRNSSLHLVTQCDAKDNLDAIRLDVLKTGAASYIMELTATIMADEDKNEEIFNLIMDCLNALKSVNNPHKIMTIFKIKLLSLSGFKPHFDSCVSCEERILGQSKFSLRLGGLLCPKCFQKDTSSKTIFRGTIATILHIERNSLENNLNLGMNPQIKKELDIILNSFLNFHLGKKLKSQKVLKGLEAI
ncbi:MAG: DNA repair protein RecO [Candidatus Omnitrophica bacterium]|nr:DNA repair protein RecO [Candidatus Omnitrophota bacterium]